MRVVFRGGPRDREVAEVDATDLALDAAHAAAAGDGFYLRTGWAMTAQTTTAVYEWQEGKR